MLVDTFPMLDRAMVAVLDLSDRAYVVLENVVPTLLGAVKLLEVLRGLGAAADRQRIVLNRYTTLPGSVKPAEVANRLGHDVDHVIPFDKGIVVAANTGEPYVLRPRRFFGCGRRLRRLVDDIDAMSAGRAASARPAPATANSLRACVDRRNNRGKRTAQLAAECAIAGRKRAERFQDQHESDKNRGRPAWN